ncbi:MAG: CAP domain-containing protein [Bacteroidota bacterium]
MKSIIPKRILFGPIILLCFFLFLNKVSAQQGEPLHLQNFDNFSNEEYAAYLEADGWPVEKLNTGKDADYLSDEEKNLILAHNLIRHDPAKFSKLYVYPRFQYFRGTLYAAPEIIPLRTREGIEAVRELYLELLETEPLPLFYPSKGMSKAAADHAMYMKRTGTASHEGKGGAGARVNRYGKWIKGLAENLAWGISNSHETVVNLMIDDGVGGRGHRRNILSPEYTKIGVAIDKHPRMTISYVMKYAVDFEER